jgi:hypothetical protein
MFFWVFPRRQIVVGRRFGTLCQFHLQRLEVDCEVCNNLTTTWHVLFIPSPSTPTHLPCTAHYLMLNIHIGPAGCSPKPWHGFKFPCFPAHLTVYFQPLKMELTQGSETSANYNLTPGKYPKEHTQSFILFVVYVSEWRQTLSLCYTLRILDRTAESIRLAQTENDAIHKSCNQSCKR